jgi:hypothetical protein
MLGSNPSADSVASTDTGDATASPFRYLAAETPYRERHQSAKSWGVGALPPQACIADADCLSKQGALS